jgi:hypothetical protein
VLRAGAAIIAVTAFSALGAGAALGDPTTGKTINAVGSNTTQDVYNGFTVGYTFNGTTHTPDAFGGTVGNWNATGAGGVIDDHITPVAGGDTFERPDGSGDGRAALSAAWNTANPSWTSSDSGNVNTLTAAVATRHEEMSFSRSSSLPKQTLWTNNPGVANNMTFLPQAIDAVGVAEGVTGTATAVSNLNTGAITAIYTGGTYTQGASPQTGDVQEVGGFPFLVTGVSHGVVTKFQVVPVLPQASSGTRSFFLTASGASSFAANIVANETGTVAQEENNPAANLNTSHIQAALNKNATPYTIPANAILVAPVSGAAVVEQLHGLTANELGTATFPNINGFTLTNGLSGVNAAIGTLQSAQSPQITFGASLVGNYDRYVWAVLPSSVVVTGSPGTEGALQTWLDQTLESSGNATTWTAYGFKSITTATSDNSANWITTTWLN